MNHRAQPWQIRSISKADNAAMAAVIHEVMTSFGAVGEGYSIEDPEMGDLSTAYSGQGHAYWVVEMAGDIVAGAGIGPLLGGDGQTCELKKMYALPVARGQGIGRALMDHCLTFAKQAGYRRCYLETLAQMDAAACLYQRYGFERLAAPLGRTGHHKCNRWMALSLADRSAADV